MGCGRKKSISRKASKKTNSEEDKKTKVSTVRSKAISRSRQAGEPLCPLAFPGWPSPRSSPGFQWWAWQAGLSAGEFSVNVLACIEVFVMCQSALRSVCLAYFLRLQQSLIWQPDRTRLLNGPPVDWSLDCRACTALTLGCGESRLVSSRLIHRLSCRRRSVF